MFNFNYLIKTGAVLALMATISCDVRAMSKVEVKPPAKGASDAQMPVVVDPRVKIDDAFKRQDYATLQQDLKDMHASSSADLALDLCEQYALSHLDPVALYMHVYFKSEVWRDRAALGSEGIAGILRMELLHLFSMLGDIGCSLVRGESEEIMRTAYHNFSSSYGHWTAVYFLRGDHARRKCSFESTLTAVNELKAAVDHSMKEEKVAWRTPGWVGFCNKPLAKGLFGHAANHEIYFTQLTKEKKFNRSIKSIKQDAEIRLICWAEAMAKAKTCSSFEEFFKLGLQDLIPETLAKMTDGSLLAEKLEALSVSDGLADPKGSVDALKTGDEDKTPAPGTPAPGTPAPGTPAPGTPKAGGALVASGATDAPAKKV